MRSFSLMLVAGLGLFFTPIAARAQKLACSPCSYNFGSVKIGESHSYSIQLTNIGKTLLTISSVSANGNAFSVGNFSLPVKINPNSSIEMPVIFSPKVTGVNEGTLALRSNAENSPLAVVVAGTGASGGTGRLQTSPSSLNFSNVPVGSTSSLQATFKAINSAVTISSDSSSNSDFAIVGMDLPLHIPEGKSVQVIINFTPKTTGAVTGSAHFVSNAVNSPALEKLSGTGITAKKTPQLGVSPATLSFGQVSVGSSATKQATLSASKGAVTISSDRSSTSEFAIQGLNLPLTIPAGKTVPVTIRFTPNASGAASAKAGFISNAENSPTLEELTGTGVAQASHTVDLTWQRGDGNAVGYNIFRGTSSSGPFAQINSGLDSSTGYTDASVESATTYYYVATEVDTNGEESAYSNVVKAVIP